MRKTVRSRQEKWERKHLAYKDSEKYVALCQDGNCHPAIKQARKTRHFLGWAAKLLVPDFLIGHPNLWDNLKTLRKHPQFRPLRMALVAWLIFSLTTGSLWGVLTLKTYAASGTSAVPNEEQDNNAPEANTEGAATGSSHNNKTDPNTGGINTTEELFVRVDTAADPGAALPIAVRMTTNGTIVGAENYTVYTRIYECSSNCSQAASWSQLGTDKTTTVTFGIGQTDTGYQTVTGHSALGTSGDITYYSVLAWAEDRQGAEQTVPANADMRVNARSDQSSLKWVVNPTADKANYNPTNGANTDPITVTGTIGYDYGATPADYGGTGETVTVTPVDQDGIELTAVTGAINADGTFSIQYTLPEAAEFGQWTVRVDYGHNGDAVAQGSDTFLVNLAFSDVTYQLFENDTTSGVKETANTGSANMGVPIFISAIPFNPGDDGETLTGIQIHWNVASPPSDVTFDSCTTLCTATTTAPTGAGNAGAAEIEITGTEQNGTDPAVTVSSSISGFSDRSITLSTTWKYSTVNTSIDNGINTGYSVYNLGETATSTFYLYNIRDQLIKGESAGTLTLEIIKAAGGNDTSVGSETVDANGFVEWSYLIGSGHQATNDASGSPKQLKTTDNDGNTVTSGNEWNVSSLLTVDNIWHAKMTSDLSEATQFFIGADNMQVKTHVQDVRNGDKSGAAVSSELYDPDGNLDTSWTPANTGADGYSGWRKIIPGPPAGTWSLKSSASDASGNSSATTTEEVSYVSSYTAKYGIRTVGWNQEYHKGDTATFTIQLLEKDANDDWVATDPDSGTTPYYEIQRWTGSAWSSVVSRTDMTVKIASSTWEASYAIDNSDTEIGKKYSVTFNAKIGGAQIAQLKEFAVVQQLLGDPVTVDASPVRATANDTVRLTIHESNLDGTSLTSNAANTSVYIYDPDNTLQVNGSNPTELANGAYYYNYSLGASPTNGVWQAVIVSTVSGSNYSAATNFEVNYQVAKETTATSTYSIAESEQTAQTAERASQASERTAQATERASSTAERTAQSTERTDQAESRTKIEDVQTKVTDVQTKVTDIQSNVDILIGAMIVTQSTVNDASASATAFVTSLTNSTDDFYKNAVLTFTSGALDGQSRRVSAYNGTTKTITLDPALTSAPANGDAFTIVAQNVRVEEQVTEHETAQATERTAQSAFRTDTTSRLTTIESKIDTITTNLNTVDTNLDSVLSTVNSIRTSQQKNYKATLSDVSEIQAGNTYRAKLTILDFESNPVDATSTPTILIYDATRAVAQATTTMTKLSTGVYEYTSSVSSSATTGLWESIVNVDVGGTADIVRNDYWQVTGAPAQVVINSMSDLTVPSISANATITNEGGGAYEYQYEWCVVSSQTNQCGGDDDVYYASAAKLIATGDSFNPTLTATVPAVGDYWFKVVVYYGTEASGASRTFTAVEETEEETTSSGGGGGGGTPSPSLATHENIYSEIIKARNQLDLNSQKLARTLEILGIVNPALQNLLSVNTLNTENLLDIQNKVADLRAVSAATRRIVEQRTVEPIVETYMKFNSVEIHFLITNPDNTQQTVKFKAFLPEEAKPEHILDLSGLKIDYDANAGVYYVSGDIALGPKETVTRKVEMKDIWVFAPEEIKSIKDQANGLTPTLAKTQYEAQGAILKNDIDSMLNIVLLRQEESYASPQDHIVVYRENKERMARAQNNLEKLKDLVVQAGASRGVVGQVGGIQTFATWGIILAIVFGFGLLAAVIFAMWRHQTMLAAAAMGMSRKELTTHFGGAARQRSRRSKKKSTTAEIQQISRGSFVWHLPWKKILVWFVIISLLTVLGILAIKFAPELFSSRKVEFKNESPVVAPTAPQEKSIGSQLVPETQENVKVFFGNNEDRETSTEALETKNPKLKITDTPTGWLNVRDSASLDGKAIGKVYPGEDYEYTDEQNGWYQIILKDKTEGWIFGNYAKKIQN